MSITFFNQWKQLAHLGSLNWIDFDLISISWEIDKMVGDFGIDLAILGFGVHIHYVSKNTRMYFRGLTGDKETESE